ncbi:MAG: extracellular solute-binding protein [Lachnospiraceae bacterium]|nr:extracellular solute-binding protein [Lachnospiraceae bacterium]
MIKKMLILMLSLILPVFDACASAGSESQVLNEKKRLIIYTSHKESIYRPIIREFEERSGIWVDVVTGGTNELLARIAGETGENSADIMFGGGVDSLRAYEDCFEPYETSQSEKLDKTYASENNSYTVFSKLPIVFVYNTRRVMPSEAPRTWGQLLDYKWKGEIAFADPVKSGSAYTALSMLMQEMSDEGYGAEETVKKFTGNLAGDLSSSSATIVEDVAGGNKMTGIVLEENALMKKLENTDIEMIYPSGSTCALPDGCAMIKNAENRENAEKFMEFIVSDDVQHLLEDKLFRRSVRTDFESSEIPGEVFYDIEYSNRHREEIMSLWEENMGKTGEE